jgi:hypothetical protein
VSLGLRSPGFLGSLALQATGGTISSVTFGGVLYKVHTFTSSGNFVIEAGQAPVYSLVVSGGGSAGSGWENPDGPRYGGGGGAGGWLLNGSDDADVTTNIPSVRGPGTYAVTVGGPGATSSAFGVTPSAGGNGGSDVDGNGGSGGSGGGGSSDFGLGGSGVAGPPRQGFNGANAAGGNNAGGGGGAGGAGSATGGGIGKSFLGTNFAVGGWHDTDPTPLGSGGGSRLNAPGVAGRAGVAVFAYRIG